MDLIITENYFTSLLAFIPALLNIGIIFYILFKLPHSKTTDIFSFIVLAVVLWQLEDTMMRITTNVEMARFWDSVFCIGWLSVGPLVFHFTLRFTSLHKLMTRTSIFLIYAPFVFFYVMYLANLQGAVYVNHDAWGWVNQPRQGTLEEIQRYCISALIIVSVAILIRHAINIKGNRDRKLQAWIIAIGIIIPAVQGILTQVVFPLFLSWEEIPITSSFMSFFSFATMIALSRFKLFRISESLQSDNLLDNLNRIVLIISPDKKIIYLNNYASEKLGISLGVSEALSFDRIFPSEDDLFKKYNDDVFEKVLTGKSVSNYSSTFSTGDGKQINVIISSSLIVNNKIKQGVLLLANDITKMVEALKDLEMERLKREKEIAEASVIAQEYERKTIGGELHDNVNQILASSLIYLNLAKRESKYEHPYLSDVNALIKTAIDEIRTLSHSMIAPSLNESGLSIAIDKIIEVANKTGTLKVEKDYVGIDETELSENLKLNIYRIVQEQFNNIIKYAQAQNVSLKIIQRDDELILNIKDDGQGFDTSKRSEGIGISNMKNRVSSNNGKMKIISSPGNGCELSVVFENITADLEQSLDI